MSSIFMAALAFLAALATWPWQVVGAILGAMAAAAAGAWALLTRGDR